MFDTLRHRLRTRRYRRHARAALRPEVPKEELRAAGYTSQEGQDRWLVETLLPGRRGGVFVDVGAHDGVSFSNTHFLETRLDWSGVAVEPNPEVFAALVRNRRCTSVQGCVAAREGTARYLQVAGYGEMLGGLVAAYDPRHRQRIERTLAEHGGSSTEIEVSTFTLGTLLDREGIRHVDYLSLDTEGGELDILASLDWQRFDVDVIGVENNYQDHRIPEFLSARGYRLHSIVGDEFYLKA